ncbi:alpha/beta fold hydrolase [Chloroflexota bacterium]
MDFSLKSTTEMERGLVKIPSVGYIHYRAIGQGKPIILMHSTGGSSTIFLELMAVLSSNMRVFAIDHPSHGMSDHITGKPAIADYARFITEVMDGLGVKKASFLGTTTSGYISVELANTYPERVEKIVMESCPVYLSEEYKRKRHADIKSANSQPTDATGFPLPRTIEFMLQSDPEHIPLHPTQSYMDRENVASAEANRDKWQLINALGEYDTISNLESLQCPVLIIWGDHFFAVQFRDEFIRHIKNPQVLVVKDARLNPLSEHPEEVGQAVLKFLG